MLTFIKSKSLSEPFNISLKDLHFQSLFFHWRSSAPGDCVEVLLFQTALLPILLLRVPFLFQNPESGISGLYIELHFLPQA